jgi:hypothetical protein
MMHTIKHEDWSLHHNSDWEGDVVLNDGYGTSTCIPAALIRACAADIFTKLADGFVSGIKDGIREGLNP